MFLTIQSAATAAALCFTPAAPALLHAGTAAVIAQAPPMVGGYRAVDVADENIQRAAAFAAEQLGIEVAEIESAQRQTVQGANYRIIFSTADGTRYSVVVYQPLRGELQLTSHEEL